MRLLEQRINEDVDFSRLARDVGLSRHHFHRLFLAETDETPANFLRRVRLDAAALRLRWTAEPSVSIADVLGYKSRAAFVRAFKRRFGMAPARYRLESSASPQPAGRGSRVSLQQVDGFRMLVKRYTGAMWDMVDHWEDFLSSLPDGLSGQRRALFAGLMYDDPRTTDPDRTRYECGVIVGAGISDRDDHLEERGLHLVTTRAGRYCRLQHQGPVEAIVDSYDHVGGWALRNNCVMTDDPAIELHVVPRSRQPSHSREFTILLPVE